MKSLHIITLAGFVVLSAAAATAEESFTPRIVIPVPDAERGRILFAAKGCVICHSVNGIGGKAGPALDSRGKDGETDPLGFAARMWNGAAAMVTLQSLELGYQVELSAQDIADLAAFVSDDALRSTYSERDVPELTRGWTIDVPFDQLGLDALDGPSEEGPDILAAGSNALRGYALSERWCAACHIVSPDGEGGVVGPAFAKIAAKPDMSEEKIRAWLADPHAKMPEFLNLVDADLADLASYIASLRQ